VFERSRRDGKVDTLIADLTRQAPPAARDRNIDRKNSALIGTQNQF
jgi:hypothetical protein